MSISRPWLDVARSAFLEELYRGRSVLCVGVGDGRAIEVLLARGAAKVVGVDADPAEAGRRLGRRAELRTGSAATVNGRFDVVFVAAGEALCGSPDALAEVCARVANGGWLVVSAENGDRAAPQGGVGYYQLVDALSPHFPSVTMVGAAPLAGAALAPFGDEASPLFDGDLATSEAQLYVAIAGPRPLTLGYGVIALPSEALGTARNEAPRPDELQRLRDESQREIGKAREESRRARADFERARKERDDLQKARDDAQRARDEAQSSSQRAHAEAQSSSQRAHAEAQLSSQRARDEAQSSSQRAHAESQRALAEAQSETQRALSEAQRLRTELSSLTRAREAAEAGVERMARDNAQLAARAKELAISVENERRRAEGSLAVELSERLAARERGMDELRQAAVLHAETMRAMEAKLDERDAYVAEMEERTRSEPALRAALEKEQARAETAVAAEREARLRAAQLAGTLLRHGIAAPEAAAPVDDARTSELEKKIAELEARGQKLEAKAADAQREAWAHMKARSEAEAGAAEVREDTVRKLKDARKVANIELMRAMEEATRKAVSLKEELTRTEAERREAIAALKGMREEHSSLLAEVARLRAAGSGPTPSVNGLREELDRLAELVTGEGARLGGIEEGLRRAVAAVAAAELDLEGGGGR